MRRGFQPMPRATWIQDLKEFRAKFDVDDPDWRDTVGVKAKIKDYITKNPGVGLSRDLFNQIVSWKLAQQEGRTSHRREVVSEDLVSKITACAFALSHPDRNALTRARLMVVQGIPGVGMGIASAILALTLPEQYGTIDPIVWKVIYGVEKEAFWITDYQRYLGELIAASAALSWPAQEVDFFAWKLGQQ